MGQHNFDESSKHNIGVPELLQKLDELYDKEEKLIKEIRKLSKIYEQLQEDKELLQMMIMHQSNKASRMRGR